MKINFWQVLGVVLLLLGLAGIIYREYVATPAPAPTPASTQPAPAVS